MNTDTPKTDQWEAYCDECYYHMWRLRRKTERGWHDGFHIHTGEEAKELCDLLNKLERERDEAREAAEKAKAYKRVLKQTNAQLKRERDEARGQLNKRMAHCKHCKQELRLGGEKHRCAEGDAAANGELDARRSAADCSAGSMLRCYRIFIDYFPWKKSEFPTYELWICSDADDARIFRQGWAARCSVLDSLPNSQDH